MAVTVDERPPGLEYGTSHHQRLRELVRSRRKLSQQYMSQLYPQMRQNEQLYRAWVDPDAKEKDGKKKYPWARSIVVPISYAVCQTMLAFDMSAFTQKRPVTSLAGVGPEDERPAKVMEQYLHYEWMQRSMTMALWQWHLDRRRYGIGWTANSWTEDVAFRTVREQTKIDLPYFGLSIPTGIKKRRETHVRYRGNEAMPLDPFAVYPDPRVPLARPQEGEFFGWRVRRSYSYMQQQEAAGIYTNVDRIPKARLRTPDSTREEESDRNRIQNLAQWHVIQGDSVDALDTGYVELDAFIVRLSPRAYGLDTSDEPELWWVTLANDDTIVRGERYEYDHMEFPVGAMESSPDYHAFSNPSDIQILQGLQEVTSWLFNSHLENVRKVLNNMLVVNPALVELEDLLSPQPGRIIRLKKEGIAQGPDVMDRAVKQLAVQDVTSGHMGNLNVVLDLIQRVAAAPENLQGVVSAKDRTLGEQQMAMMSASGRLKIAAQLAWQQGMVPWTRQRVANVQQLMDEERWVKVVGEYARALGIDRTEPFLRVTPAEIQGHYTYDVIDGTIRGSDALLETWREVFSEVSRNPLLQQRLDAVEIFRTLAMMSGISNIDDYVLQGQPVPPMAPANVRVMGDEQLGRQVERGNLRALPNPMDPTRAAA